VTTSFEVSFDYRCPFAKNIHLHVVHALREGADFDVTFVPWTLSQGHRIEGAPDVWSDPAYDADLLSLAAGVSVRDQQADLFLEAHEALFRARHEQGVRLVTLEEIAGVLAPLGVDMDMVRADIDSRRPHEVIAESYQDHARYEAFGVPTFVVGSDATFVRYMTAPTGSGAQSAKIIDSIVSLIALEPELNEFKHTRLPL
jgi:predicted DsbA family dithiol-disulfide isomerase